MKIQELQSLVEALNAELKTYSTKATKASSKRIRQYLGEIKTNTPQIRRSLVELDKKGY